MNKFTRFNHSVSAQAVHRVIHHLIDDVAFTWLQDNWKQKKDGTFYKAVNDSLNRFIETVVEHIEKEIFKDYGKRIKIRVWQEWHSFGTENPDSRPQVVFLVDATYRVVDTSGENSHSCGYVKNSLYVYKNAPNWDESKVPELKHPYKEIYPIRQPDEVEEVLLKKAEIDLQIDALREQERNLSREFGYTYLEKR